MMKEMILRRGDSVALAAPARKVTYEEIEPAIELFESWGLKVVVPDHLFDADNQMAGSDETRAALMQSLLDDAGIKAIVCARGGYGTVRIVDRLDFGCFWRRPKFIVGYSDITVLHSHVAAHSDVATVHATMPINICKEDVKAGTPATESLRRLLFEGRGEIRGVAEESRSMNRTGKARGRIVGGNLSVIYSLIGSPSDVSTVGKILLIEDLDEYLYHIDRMMMALKRAGKLANLRGLIVGGMSDMHDNSIPFGRSAEEIVRDAVAEYGYPVVYNAPFGHIGSKNIALPLNVEVEMEVADKELVIDF